MLGILFLLLLFSLFPFMHVGWRGHLIILLGTVNEFYIQQLCLDLKQVEIDCMTSFLHLNSIHVTIVPNKNTCYCTLEVEFMYPFHYIIFFY